MLFYGTYKTMKVGCLQVLRSSPLTQLQVIQTTAAE